MNRDKVEIFKGLDAQWYFRVLAGNGEPISQSEGYKRQIDAKETVETHFPGVPIVVLDEA